MKLMMTLLLLAMPFFSYAAQDVIGDDGRQIRLNDDGSWVYRSEDRFATNADGRRVRLKDDGSWVYTGEKAAAKKRVTDQRYVEEQALEITLIDVVIESFRGKKSESHKNSRKKTYSVFYLNLTVDSDAAAAVNLNLNLDDFKVEDSDGRHYPILSVEPASEKIKPGDEAIVIIRTDGSPHWWTTKSMAVIIDKSALASRKDIELSRPMSMAKKKNVKSSD